MADYRRHFDEGPRRPEREWTERPTDDSRPWFDDRHGHYEADRAASEFRDDRISRWEGARESQARRVAYNPEDWGVQHLPSREDGPQSWGRIERGGYWRRYEPRGFQGRGPKGYQRSDDRIRDEICDCMTDDPALDASEIEVAVVQGEVTLTGSVTSRDQKRRAEDVAERASGVRDVTNQLRVTASSQPVTEASGKGTPSKSTSGTTA
jgi:hypothetical protein